MSSGDSIKNPGGEAENPAPMPIDGQKENSPRGPTPKGTIGAKRSRIPKGSKDRPLANFTLFAKVRFT
jgi:hypothetical protein